MANMIVCEGDFAVLEYGRQTIANSIGCESGWLVIPYVEPTDSTLIYSQLIALNEFDPERAGSIIVGCLATFLLGFGVGVVIKLLRRL